METEQKEISSSALRTGSTEEGLFVTGLDEYSDHTIIDQTMLASMLKVTTRTIRRMVERYELPGPVHFAGHRVWTVKALRDHLCARLDKELIETQKAKKRVETALNC